VSSEIDLTKLTIHALLIKTGKDSRRLLDCTVGLSYWSVGTKSELVQRSELPSDH
jgi:hypothetical protein